MAVATMVGVGGRVAGMGENMDGASSWPEWYSCASCLIQPFFGTFFFFCQQGTFLVSASHFLPVPYLSDLAS